MKKVFAPGSLVPHYKVADYSTATLESLASSQAQRLYTKVNSGEAVSDDEEDELFNALDQGRKTTYRWMGWAFSFVGYLKRYLLITDFGQEIVFAPSKAAIRRYYDTSTIELLEIARLK